MNNKNINDNDDNELKVGKTPKENWDLLRKSLKNDLFKDNKDEYYTGKKGPKDHYIFKDIDDLDQDW